jgi:hypothetical protein
VPERLDEASIEAGPEIRQRSPAQTSLRDGKPIGQRRTRELAKRLLVVQRVAAVGQHLDEDAVDEWLTVDEHTVAIEDDQIGAEPSTRG